MSSRSWGPGKAPGDGQESARGTVGTDAAATPIGSARVLIAWVSLMLTLLCVVLVFAVTRNRDGLLLLATIFFLVHAWAVGAFTKTLWSR